MSEGLHDVHDVRWRSDVVSPTWITRGGGPNFVIAITKAKASAVLEREDNPDEYMPVLPKETSASQSAGDQTVYVDGDTLAILPLGPSSVTVGAGGLVLRIFSNRAVGDATEARNSVAYAKPVPASYSVAPGGFTAIGLASLHGRLGIGAGPTVWTLASPGYV